MGMMDGLLGGIVGAGVVSAVNSILEKNGGTVVKTIGDAVMAALSDDLDGLVASLAILRAFDIAELTDQFLAACTEQHRNAKAVIETHLGQNGDVVLQVLAETDPRIDDEPRLRNTGGDTGLNAPFQKVEHVQRHIPVHWIVSHRFRITLRMHQDDRQTGLRGDRHGIRVVRQCRDVVEDVGAGFRRAMHDLRLASVDRDQRLGAPAKTFEHRHDAP